MTTAPTSLAQAINQYRQARAALEAAPDDFCDTPQDRELMRASAMVQNWSKGVGNDAELIEAMRLIKLEDAICDDLSEALFNGVLAYLERRFSN